MKYVHKFIIIKTESIQMVHFQFYILYSAFSLASSAILDGYSYSGIAFSAKDTCNAALEFFHVSVS